MKRLAAVLLAISLTISGCTAAPADASNTAATTAASSDFKEAAAEAIEETEEKAAEAAEETAAEATEDAEETDEAAAGETGKTADRSAEEPAGSTDQTTVKNSLVILEQDDNDYRSAAAKKRSEDADATASALYTVGKDKEADAANSTAAGTTGAGTATAEQPEEKDYTVMVYIVGSNLESRYGSATKDIVEMKEAGLDYEKTNLLVYTGGSKRWVSDLPSTSNNVLDMSKEAEQETGTGYDGRIIAQTRESADMGIPQTLKEFINYCTDNYPAEHYGLVLWDHGMGPVWGYGSDELFQNDSLLLEELREAMGGTDFGPQGSGKKLDWVGFDACLMNTLENARLWKDYAHYLVGSEELEPGRGWDYSFLRVLNGTSDAEEIVTGIVDSYGRYYEENRSVFFDPDVTLAALDLAKTDEVIGAADELFFAMTEGIGKGKYASINQARRSAKTFGLSVAESGEDGMDMIDLKDFAAKAGELFPQESVKLAEAVDSMVVGASGNVEGAGGVSVYLPGDNRELYGIAQEIYGQGEILSETYEGFVDAYTKAWFAGSDTDWTLGELKKGNGEMTLALTPEQVQNASEIYYSILSRNSMGGYQLATCNVRVTPDENNVLHIPGDPLLVTAGTDLQDSIKPWAFAQVSDNEGECVYKTVGAVLTSGHEFVIYDPESDEEVSISIKNRTGETEAAIRDFTSAAGSAWASGKDSIDVSGYRSIIDIGADTFSPVRSEDGSMKPYTEWKKTGHEYHPMAVDASFRFSMQPASEFPVYCICQVTVKDVNGKIHASEFTQLPFKADRLEEVDTETGALGFEIMEDYAMLSYYYGNDISVTVPASVAGLPVTVIDSSALASSPMLETIILPDTVTEIRKNAFYNNPALRQVRLPSQLRSLGMAAFWMSGIEEIKLPEGLEKIGRGAFQDTGLRSVTLPASLQSIGEMPFAGSADLEEITISPDNPNYETVDGVLYTKDGGTLIQYPAQKGSEYTVIEGTEVIGYGAFAGTDVRRVTFPETLRRIENAAFFECFDLEELELPDSLERIGNLAFGMDRKSVPEGGTHFDVVRIGPGVSSIGNDAFTALDIEAFDVDSSNETYSSSGGLITNKAGDLIQAVPSGADGKIVIPDGITTLQNGIFTLLDEKTEFYVPGSVFRFSENVFPCERETSKQSGKLENVYYCTIHCSPDSAAREYAYRYDIKWDDLTDPGTPGREIVTEKTEAGTYHWRVNSDHAELIAFTGNEEVRNVTLEIPSRFRDLPVTAIRYEKELCDDGTNSSVNIIKIVIPETVVTIENRFFNSHWLLGEIEVSAENPSYVSEDGVLFTKDMRTLLSCPIVKPDTEYAMPFGVTEVEDYAFFTNQNLEKLVMSPSLKVIGICGFGGCLKLREVQFNRGLKELYDSAFMFCPIENAELPDTLEWIGSGAFTPHEGFGRVELPEKVKKVGLGAFWAKAEAPFTQEVIRIPAKLEIEQVITENVLFERYEVDPKNPYYKEENGILTSRDGKTFVSVPTLTEGEVHIPEGTLYLAPYLFYGCDRVTDVYLPDSLLDLGDMATCFSSGQYDFTVHCRRGSEPQKLLEAMSVPWEEIND